MIAELIVGMVFVAWLERRKPTALEIEASLRLAEKEKELKEAEIAQKKAETKRAEAEHAARIAGFVEVAFLRQEREQERKQAERARRRVEAAKRHFGLQDFTGCDRTGRGSGRLQLVGARSEVNA